MIVPSVDETDKGEAALQCEIANAGNSIVPASNAYRVFFILISSTGLDKVPSSSFRRPPHESPKP